MTALVTREEMERVMAERDRLRELNQEMLAALIELRNYYIETTGLPPCAANAAIAKARGGRP